MEPEDVLREYETRINEHRFDAVEPLISDEAVYWFSDGSHSGKAAIRAAFEKTWRAINNDRYWLEERVWIARGDAAACCTYRFHWETEIDGKRVGGTGRGTTVLRRESAGWKIVHEHLSAGA